MLLYEATKLTSSEKSVLSQLMHHPSSALVVTQISGGSSVLTGEFGKLGWDASLQSDGRCGGVGV